MVGNTIIGPAKTRLGRQSRDMEKTLPFPKLDREIYPSHALPISTALEEGLIPDVRPSTIQALMEAGYTIVNFPYRLTSDSRREVNVPIICSTAAVAARPPHILVQTLALAAGRRHFGASWCRWMSTPHLTARINGDGRYVSGAMADGRWREMVGDEIREWIIEYSHGEFTSRRLADVIRRHGRRPQLWLTSSRAHAEKIRQVLAETLPGYPHVRVEVVNWTGGAFELP